MLIGVLETVVPTCVDDTAYVVQILETKQDLLRDVLHNTGCDTLVTVFAKLPDIVYAVSQDLCNQAAV